MRKVRKELAVIMAALMITLTLMSCSTGGGGTAFDICSAVSVVQTQQTAIETAAAAMIALANTTSIPADVLAKAKQTYGLWYDAQAPIQTTLIAINDSGGNPGSISIQQYVQLMVQMAALVAEFIAMYNSVSKAPAMTNEKMSLARAAASGCVMTDAQITAAITPKSWTDLGGK